MERYNLFSQIIWLFMLSIPVACISWTVTHEEIFKQPREYFTRCSKEKKYFFLRAFFYVFTCEYCFSHYIAIAFILLCNFRLLVQDWRGYIISLFSVVWIANVYMSIFGRLRIGIKKEKVEIELDDERLRDKKNTGK